MHSIRLVLDMFKRRRVAALFAAACISVGQAETVLPDAHDGDASASQMAPAADQDGPAKAPGGAPASHQEHAVHVDHCAHAHVYSSTDSLGLEELFSARAAAPVTIASRLASVTISPHSRPPIA